MTPNNELVRDLRDIFVWLEHRYGARGDIWLHVMRAPSQPVSEISIATVDTDRKDLDISRLHDDFLSALAALGYRMGWPQDGADPEDVDVPSKETAAQHEQLESIARVEQAMHVVRPFRRRLG